MDYLTVHDGTSMTLMLSENLNAGSYCDPNAQGMADSSMGGGGMGGMGMNLPFAVLEAMQGFVWWGDVDGGGNPTPPYASGVQYGRINSAADSDSNNNPNYPYTNARPSSNHPGGVNMLYCDGHGRYMSQDVDSRVYCLLMSSWGQQVMPPGTMMAPSTAIWKYLRTAVVDESAVE
jgi:prepilin-type processing-associated H-X9-DG protein